MQEGYYSKYFLGMYFQLLKSGYFQIVRKKRNGNWTVVMKWKVDIDPVKYCETYKIKGCAHVDGYMCNMQTCNFNTLDKIKNLKKL